MFLAYLLLVVLAAVNLYGVAYLGMLVLRRENGSPTPTVEPVVVDEIPRTVGGEWRQMVGSRDSRRFVRESEFLLPSSLVVNRVPVLPLYARACLSANNMSRETLLTLNVRGRKVPDNDVARNWHADLKTLFLDAVWAIPGPGGGIMLNAAGRDALAVIANDGEDGMVRLLRRVVEQRLASELDSPQRMGESVG